MFPTSRSAVNGLDRKTPIMSDTGFGHQRDLFAEVFGAAVQAPVVDEFS